MFVQTFHSIILGQSKKQHDAKKQIGQQTVEIKMDDELNIQTDYYFWNKLESLFTKRNHYGTNQLFQVLGEKQLEDIFKLAGEDLKMPAWIYNGKVLFKS